jgi:hypothetical protein
MAKKGTIMLYLIQMWRISLPLCTYLQSSQDIEMSGQAEIHEGQTVLHHIPVDSRSVA